MNPDLRNLVNLQDVDQKILNLKKQILEIPGRIQSWRDELLRMVEAHQSRVALSQDLAKQRRSREGEVELMRAKLSRLRDQLMAVKTNKEYTAMLHEIQAAEEQIRQAEDGILEIMERLESMEGKLERDARDLQAQEKELEEQILKAEETVPRLEAEAERLSRERLALEGLIASELLARYRRLSDARKGLALAEAKDELCTACHVRIRPQVFAELRQANEIHACDSCSRILFVRD